MNMKINYRINHYILIFVSITISFILLIYASNFDTKKEPLIKKRVTSRTFRKRRNATIPKNLHFIWNNLSVPNEFAENIKGFVKNNPPGRWTYYFWTKESALGFIKQNYNFLHLKVAGVSDMFRADVLRYLVIHEFGGAYFDLDTVSVKPLDNYVESHDCSLTSEPGEHLFLWNLDLLINNGALLCVPGHPFFKHIIYQLSQLHDQCKDAFLCTGPMFLTNMYRNMNRTSGKLGKIPRLEPSEIFQDVYDDPMLHGHLNKNCFNTSHLPPKKVEICNKWRARGMEKRNLSEKALVYHAWFHTNIRKVTYSDKNLVFNLIPNVRFHG